MRVRAIGVHRMGGIGKSSGNKYDFAQLTVQVPVEQVQTANMQKTGFGFEAQTIDINLAMFAKFAHVVFPADLELIMEQQVTRKGIESVITDFKEAKVAPVAARVA